MPEVAVLYHSADGHTRALAEALVRGLASRGAEALCIDVSDLEAIDWAALGRADALVFGCPTYMGSTSATFKAFMDASHDVWVRREWQDKIAAGFTHSSSLSGDKQTVLFQLATFAAQHGMLWVSLGALPGRAEADVNRFGSSLGAMASSGREPTPPDGDIRTAFELGARVANAAFRWTGTSPPADDTARHPATKHWQFPPSRAELSAPLSRVNLRELAARPGRFEHHLMVVGTVGDAQLEIATASEPLYFAHLNISDEYALPMLTGDAAADGFPMLTLLSDPATNEDVARYRGHAGDLVLHPHGILHWPGRLRPPHRPFVFGKGQRRCVYSFVFCGNRPIEPGERPLFASRPDAPKVYRGDPALMFCDTRKESSRLVGVIGNATLRLEVEPAQVSLPMGGYVVVLEGEGDHFPGDLIHLPPDAVLPGRGLHRVLVATSTERAALPPSTWAEVPSAPFARFEDGVRGTLPIEVGGMRFVDEGELARISLGEHSTLVPRYWLARFLFRTALHGYAMGYLETYGGFTYDDRDGLRIGLRGGGSVDVDPAAIERIYRAIAPDEYTERLDD